jgi:DNA-binding winged helix-turn-helix (wHTH) protein
MDPLRVGKFVLNVLERPGDVVTRDELQRHLWSDGSRHCRQARRAAA